MVYPQELPTVAPRWSTRRISAAEVVRLWQREDVPGLTPHDPRVQSIRHCTLSTSGRLAFADARRTGYLYVNLPSHEAAYRHNLETLWAWWCAASGHPEIVLSTARDSDAVRLRCDLAPTGRSWGYDAFRRIGRLLCQLLPVGRASWLFTEQELQVEGLEMEEAIGLARDLVLIASGGRFRPQDASPAPPVHAPRSTDQTRMERTDQ
jgi:hypothetical protein